MDGTTIDLGDPVAGGDTFTKEIALPRGRAAVTVRAVDEAEKAARRACSSAPGLGRGRLRRRRLRRRGEQGGGFVALQPGAVTRPARPRLTLKLKYRHGAPEAAGPATAHAAGCA